MRGGTGNIASHVESGLKANKRTDEKKWLSVFSLARDVTAAGHTESSPSLAGVIVNQPGQAKGLFLLPAFFFSRLCVYLAFPTLDSPPSLLLILLIFRRLRNPDNFYAIATYRLFSIT